jgi:pimeloyl-ACP methyl ester carboxylesterase
MSPDASEEEIAAADSLIGEQNPAVLAAIAAGMQQIICLPSGTFENCHFPVLGVTGELDPERNNVEQLAEVFADFRLTIIPGADHMNALADPLFYKSITAFIAEH